EGTAPDAVCRARLGPKVGYRLIYLKHALSVILAFIGTIIVAVIASLISAEASKAKLDAQLEEGARRSLSRVE
ncbi:MAG: hypothetical protein JWN19_1159, partial [Arthrobacter sp.]|nr:hypothetical protein [Arthrobacter sp.]